MTPVEEYIREHSARVYMQALHVISINLIIIAVSCIDIDTPTTNKCQLVTYYLLLCF